MVKFGCAECIGQFQDLNAVETHVRKEHSKSDVNRNSKPHICDKCSYNAAYKSHLKRHMRAVHEKLKPFICDLCDKQFARKSCLDMHLLAVHEKLKPFKCDICNQTYTSKSTLKRHVVMVHLFSKESV